MSKTVLYRSFTASDRAGLLGLFEAVYGVGWRDKTSSWRYLDTAQTVPLIWVAEADGRIVGAQPSHAMPLQFEGRSVTGALLLDVMTHPDYRRRGIFAGVVEGLRAELHRRDCRVVITTPNRGAARGFARLPAWQEIGELVPLVRPTRVLPLLHRGWGGRDDSGRAMGLPGGLPQSIAAVPGADDLWEKFSRWCGIATPRDAAFLAWRFGPGSGRSYRLLEVTDLGRRTAAAIVTPGYLLGRRVLLVADLVATDPGAAALVQVLRETIAMARGAGAAAAVSYLVPASPLLRAACEAGFVQVPALLRPRPYTIWLATNLEGAAGRAIRTLERWHMTLADSDLA